ncbi:MAG TPA: hypothetical protein VII99_13410, partial [Bacteroidia bacterium]
DYDYLYLVGPPGPNPMPNRLAALTADSSFTLYRIVRLPSEENALKTLIHQSGGEILRQPDGCLKQSTSLAAM